MHLKALRLRGFKSFAHGVELRFESGIAVIIGPNGSGKSNIADGLQWAMAAQTPAQLRAPTAQDVLFGGSDSRPPAGVCEVELVLDNRCGTLPIEFAEVSVMRRLHRDSEGEYFINRSRVRRLDVLELLADTGLGREMHSVIGQGKVEEVLVAKPHERRRFVEEAAGLGKYQRRRSRAEAKLARVSAELERARDLEREVRARLRPLAMQATAAERAAKLGQEIAAGRLLLLSSELALERAGAGDLQQKLDAARLALGVVEQRAEEIASRRAAAESELAGLAAAQERAARAFYAFQSARDRLSTTAGRAEQVAAALDRAGRRRVEDASRLREDAARLLRDAQAAETEAGGHAAEVAELEMRDVGAADEALAAAEAALGAALDARRALANAQGQADTAVRELEGAASRVRELRQRVEQLEQTAATSASQLAEADVRAGEAATVLEQHRGTLKQAEAAAERAHQQAETVTERERAARAAAEELAHRLQIDRSRLDALDGMLQRGEGLPPAVRELQRAGARLVIHGVEAQPGFERAVAAALGWRTGAVVAEHVDEGLDLLHQGQGEMGVVLVSGGGGTRDMPPAPGARQLVEVVTLTDPALAWLLEGIWLVEDLARVTHGVAVTVAGTGIDVDRGELWRTADAGEAAWMAARAERDQLRHSVAELEQRWTEAGAVAERLGEELTAASAAETAAAEALRQARLLESELAAGEREAAAKRDQLADQLARGDAARDLAAHDLEHETSRLRELEAAAEGQAAVLEERRAAAAAADERHAALDLTRQRLAEEAGKIAGRLAALRERAERFG
ncbi:MAG: AAA family ATPase, partial [Gaiellales bacterium]